MREQDLFLDLILNNRREIRSLILNSDLPREQIAQRIIPAVAKAIEAKADDSSVSKIAAELVDHVLAA